MEKLNNSLIELSCTRLYMFDAGRAMITRIRCCCLHDLLIYLVGMHLHLSDVIISEMASNHQPHDCLLDRLFRRRSKKTSKLRVTGLCAGNSPVTGEFPAQRASNAENVSI